MSDPVVIFRTHSAAEASIVRGLLETHGIPSMAASSGASQFPIAVNELGEVRVSVKPDDAEEAREVIDRHRTEVSARVVRLRDEFATLERDIAYRFRDRGLLEHAMTHASRAHEDPSGGTRDNESLEFLGDAILGFAVADMLFRECPTWDEGRKSKAKAALVSTTNLAGLAERLALGDHLLLGRGEERSGGRLKPTLLADAYEALIAAIYLDGGIEQARAFIERGFRPLLSEIADGRVSGRDFKSALQEALQSTGASLPIYRLVGTSGPDHQKQFSVEVVVDDVALARGEGASKKEAEQDAARSALEELSRSR